MADDAEADAFVLALRAYTDTRDYVAHDEEDAFEAGWDAAIAFTRHQAPQHEGHRRIDLGDGKWWCATCGSGPYAEGT